VLLRDLLLFLLLLLLLLQQLNDRRETTTDIGTASTFTFAAVFTSARPDTTAHEPVATAKVIHEVAIVQNDAASKKKPKKEQKLLYLLRNERYRKESTKTKTEGEKKIQENSSATSNAAAINPSKQRQTTK